MKFLKSALQSGFTMVEMSVALALTAVLGMVIYGVMNYTDRQSKIQTENIQDLILRYGASKVLVRDIANAAPTFNYINIKDDDNLPFFVYSQNEYCQPAAACSRKFTMEIPANNTLSEPIFFLSVKGASDEMIRFGIDPSMTFDSSTNDYLGVNYEKVVDATTGISKDIKPESPWVKDRIVLLQSANSFYDCNSTVNSFTPAPAGSCNVTGPDFATTRQMKLLGVVNSDEIDMTYTPVASRPNLLKNTYNICRPDQNLDCAINPAISDLIINSSAKLIENMPYIPGSDNLASITPVELIRYHLERPAPNSPDTKIVLMRSVATIVGGQLSFERAHVLMSGIQSIVFTRKNVSTPTIEYKLIKVRYQSAIK